MNVNVIAVLAPNRDKLLMCHRRRPPYQGRYNLVGGKIEPGEDGLDAAYRELREETGITPASIELLHLMDFEYDIAQVHLEVYFGVLQQMLPVQGEENDLLWVDTGENFFDMARFAGEGNLGHIMAQIQYYFEQKCYADI